MSSLQSQSLKPESKPKLLIVDDQTINIQVLYHAFATEFQVFMATSGAKALSICEKDAIDLVLLDVMMPEMDGYEVCTRLKANPVTSDIPVIFVTAHRDEVSEEHGLEVGAVDFISKPINLKIVRARVRAHIALKCQSDLLRNFAFMDGLTGVRNRRYFDEQLGIEVARAQRSKLPLSLILIDVDFFKRFNDCYGHQGGDDCLRRLGRLFQTSIKRPADFVARYGGEEFVCVLPETPFPKALEFAESIRMAVLACQIPHTDSTVSEWLTLSLGVGTMAPDSPLASYQLLQLVDDNLYQAKKLGRNQVVGSVN
ncbi:MAG: diguanylate cyclase [Burkholderiales bacterium]|jgi:diguanylate cyclase (GGDEF)-like protein|nr:diguanylate cyclase [Burkholderiales bacterium]